VYAGKVIGEHCHHIDFNKLNNNPPNLRRLSKEAHLKLQQRTCGKTLHREDVIQKCREIKNSNSFRNMMSNRMQQPETRKILSENAKSQWENETYKSYMIEKWREFYSSNEDYRKENNEQLNRAQSEYWNDENNRLDQARRVKEYFANNPEAKKRNSMLALEEWKDSELLEWRCEKNKEAMDS